MKINLNAIPVLFARWRERLQAGTQPTQAQVDSEPPLRSVLLSADQMEQHGHSLAASHTVSTGRGSERLVTRLSENEESLLNTCKLLAETIKANRRIAPAGEWLLDNFYLIEEQIRTAKKHLPKGYSRQLPRLARGASIDLPRVYDIALEAISHGDGRVDLESLSRFVAAYQKITVLTLGELWAIPIMLRLALIENLRRVGAQVAAGTHDRDLADAWADQMIAIVEKDPKSLILVVSDMARSNPPMSSPFVSEFARRLQGQSAALALPLTWVEQRLSETGMTMKQSVQSESHNQAAEQVSISNSIGSLRFLGAMDWRELVETMSAVEHKLLEDPVGIYGRMDFATRDRYRHVVERIAKGSQLAESEVARKAIQLANEGYARAGQQDRTAHVGYYLISRGLTQLERAAETRLALGEATLRAVCQLPLLRYLGGIALFTLATTALLLDHAYAHGHGLPAWPLAGLGLLGLLCTSQLAVSLMNWLVTLLATPHQLPRLDYAEGIPSESRTLVVVPTMITSSQNIEALIEALEVRFLANRDTNLHFGLLTDFRDAAEETLPQDAALLAQAAASIAELNEKYPSEEHGDIFFLFHRARRWNAQEKRWMGYERKRGKLADLNALLRGGSKAFSCIVGDTEHLSNVKYVITLDTDTQLPRDAAWQFVAAMAHPLNQAHFDEEKQRVVDGYGILQPGMAVSVAGSNGSRYARLCGSEPGIDPYTRAVSDVYQDLFGEGSFIGKGIYEVDAFEHAVGGRLPENRILSHDLLEGCYARAGLLSDVQLYEEYPALYSADVARRHRWIRGDWQIASWLLGRVPGANGRGVRNPISALSQWKIFDNLRRSLVPIGLTALLLLGWTVLHGAAYWTGAVLSMLFIPALIASVLGVARKSEDVLLGQHLSAAFGSAHQHLSGALFGFVCLPYEAYYSLDAIVRTLWRIAFSHRGLLEWNPSSNNNEQRADLLSSYRTMWFAPVLAIACAGYLVAMAQVAIWVAAPVLCLWFVAPAVAWWLSRPIGRRVAALSPDQKVYLQKIARKTWAFYETFVGAEDNWLPPDNYQEHPVEVIAHRTSPTNMGLALLANLTAYDFGYILAGQLIERTDNTLHTMAGLEQYHGHFFNWYDTQSLQPLHPRYVSSVDSGNLAGHLLVLRRGLLQLPDQPIVGARLFDGLTDTLRVLADVAGIDAKSRLNQLRRDLESAYDSRANTIAAVHRWLVKLNTAAADIASTFAITYADQPENTAIWWAQALARECQGALDEVILLAPWILLPPAPTALAEFSVANDIPSLRELAVLDTKWQPLIADRMALASSAAERGWLEEFSHAIKAAQERALERMASSERLALQAGQLAWMEFDFLYDKSRNLLAIGYNVSDRRRDSSFYDLLASEARLCNFVAIAQGQLQQESWFALGRQLTAAGGEPTLLSWSGSMFEYLMPLLIMPTYDNTLLDETYQATVKRQIAYGHQRGVPWGVSESGYNAFDVRRNYQYRAFGVPGMGLKRGLAEDLVIAPYASAMSLMVMPEAACQNLQLLSSQGVEGRYGMYEAVDYTPSRLPRGQSSAIVRSFMVHHQGMSFLALAYLLLDRPMQQRFEADPLFQSTRLLLQERVPKATAYYMHTAELSEIRPIATGMEMPIRVLNTPDSAIPEVQLLSNGRYHVMVTNAGGGYSRCRDMAVTRWREDTTCDNWGTFCYIRDVASGVFWSTAHQPTLKRAEAYEAIFSEGRAEFRRRDLELDTHTEIVVSPEDDVELRRTRITNRSRTRRTVEVTSYAEVVLAPAAADSAHPAFSNLFVQTEILPQQQAILCTRRARGQHEAVPHMFHVLAVHGADVEETSYETDRSRFIGRGRTVAAPEAMSDARVLSGSEGSVLDPIVAIRYRIVLEPEQTATIDMVTGMAESREGSVALASKYHDRRLADRVFELAWTHSQVVLRQINATEADAQIYRRLASSVIYANSSLRADAAILTKNRRGQSGLWSYAISGDLPIVLLQIGDLANISLVHQLVQAHAYWVLKGLSVDLVIWNEDHAGYRQLLQEQIMGMIAVGIETAVMDRPGGIFVRQAEQISDEDRILIQTVARAIISDSRGSLADQINRRGFAAKRPARLVPTKIHRPQFPGAELPQRDLIFNNGLGGFTADGREYVITTTHRQVTPAPWVNVIANVNFGTVISESGLAYTWCGNAHEYRLTPWQNDPVSDAAGEAYYLRDEESGHFWSPTPLPCRGLTPYISRHGFGYSVFEHIEDGIHTELTVYVAVDAPVKFAVLKIRNQSGRPRQLSATGYVEWVLGDLRPKSAMHVVTEIDAANGALYARNRYNTEFAESVAFFDVDDGTRTATGDRTEFLGRNGTLKHPAAMTQARLSGKIGAGLDPCGAMQVNFDLVDGQEREVTFRLGLGRNTEDVRQLVQRFRGAAANRHALDAVHQYWNHTLGAVQIQTPNQAVNILANGWLVYQTLACRVWARSGYYQSGGAYGFRDQLQDTMALIHAEPKLVREHLLRSAGHQFREGDVQHWWHPPADRGVRTHCSDDYLWLPLVTCRYVLGTGDTGVLDERVHFIEGRLVNPDEESYYDLPNRSEESATLYQHCIRAIEHGLRYGEHGLPLIGAGDWNDGMNLVGEHGKGESIWLAFFLYEVLIRFSELARQHGDQAFADRCQAEAVTLHNNVEQHGWDGEWYRRAYFDDGTPLGCASNAECQIDSIAQSWSVLSGGGDPQRARSAMEAVDRRLVRRKEGLIQLFDPPFDKSDLNPGYIKGYVPGVRENGGQYTHGAVWTTMAFAALGDSRRAWELLDLINPVNHGKTAQSIAVYKVEPYVMAADVYAVSPHTGRGGWTWYTGSAGWTYQLIIESLLGLKLEIDKLRFTPCIPADWEQFTIYYRYRETNYQIIVSQTYAAMSAVKVIVDGVVQTDGLISLIDDRQMHEVEIILSTRSN